MTDILAQDLCLIAKTAEGRAVIWAFLEMCDIYSVSNVGDAFNEGRRDVGIQFLTALNDADPTIYPKLIKEHIK